MRGRLHVGRRAINKGSCVRNPEVGHPQSRLIQPLTEVLEWPASFLFSELHPPWDALSLGLSLLW